MFESCQYDEHQIPPNWTVAEDHGKAVRSGRPPHAACKKQNQFQTDMICPCCFKYIEKQPIAYCEDTKDLAFLGVGFPLFYNFMRLCLLLLASLIVDSCVMSITMNLHENKCSDSNDDTNVLKCGRDLLAQMSYISSQPPNIYRSTMKILAFCVSLFVIVYIRKEQTHMTNYLEERNTLISQFTFIIEGVPRGSAHNQELIRRLIEDLKEEQHMEVIDVLLIEDLNEYLLKKKAMDLLMASKKKLYQGGTPKEQDIKRLNENHDKIREQLEQIREKMTLQEDRYFIGTAIVKMNTERQKLEVMKLINDIDESYVRRYFNNYVQKQGRIRARDAPPPTDLIWQNIHYSTSTRMLSLVAGWIVSLLVLVVVTVAVFYIIRKKSQLIDASHTEEDDTVAVKYLATGEMLSYIMVVLISVFNKFIMSTIFHHICNHEKHESYSDLQFSFALKYMLGMFFTTALMTLMVEAIIFHNYSDHGVVEQEIIMAVFNAFFSPLMYLVNPDYIIRWIKLRFSYGRKDMTQKQANQLMEYPDYDLGKRYAQVMKVMWFSMLYTWLIPIAPIISFLGITLYYFVDKFVLLRKCSVKQSISVGLSRKIFRLLEISLLLQPAGEILFDLQIRQYLSVSSIGMLAVAILYLLLPMDYFLDCLFHESFIPEKLTFDEAKIQFEHFYTSCYPVRRKEALRDLIEGVKGTTRHRAIRAQVSRFTLRDDTERTVDNRRQAHSAITYIADSSHHLHQPKLKPIKTKMPSIEKTLVKEY